MASSEVSEDSGSKLSDNERLCTQGLAVKCDLPCSTSVSPGIQVTPPALPPLVSVTIRSSSVAGAPAGGASSTGTHPESAISHKSSTMASLQDPADHGSRSSDNEPPRSLALNMANPPIGPHYDVAALFRDALCRGMWDVVGRYLKRQFPTEVKTFIIILALEHATNKQLKRYVLPKCSRFDLNNTILFLLSKGLRREAERVLECVDCDWSVHPDILSLLYLAVKSDWDKLQKVLHQCMCDSETLLENTKRYAGKQCRQLLFFTRSSDGLLKPITPMETTEGWTPGGRGLQGSTLTDLPLVCFIVIDTCTHDQTGSMIFIVRSCSGKLVDDILEHVHSFTEKVKENRCAQHQKGTSWQGKWTIYMVDDGTSEKLTFRSVDFDHIPLITEIRQMFTHDVWLAVRMMMPTVEQTVRVDVVRKALKQADDFVLSRFILPLCNSDQLDELLACLMAQDLWESVKRMVVLVGKTKNAWKVEESLLDSELMRMLVEGLWTSVANAIQQGVSDSQLEGILNIAFRRTKDTEMKETILPHFNTEQTGRMVTSLIARGRWERVVQLLRLMEDRKQMLKIGDTEVSKDLVQAVAMLSWKSIDGILRSNCDDIQRMWALDTSMQRLEGMDSPASNKETDNDFSKYIMSHCSDDQLESVLAFAVNLQMWSVVDKVLYRVVPEEKRTWAIHKACELAIEESLERILQHCTYKELEVLKKTSTQKGWWHALVLLLLEHTFSITFASELNDLPEEHRDYLLKKLLDKRENPHTLDAVLERGVSDPVRRLAIQEVLKRTENKKTGQIYKKVHAKTLEMPDTVKHATKGRMALSHANQIVKEKDLILYILPYYFYDEAELTMIVLKERGLWKASFALLFRFVTDTLYKWAVADDSGEIMDGAFWRMFQNPGHTEDDLQNLCKAARHCIHKQESQASLSDQLHKDGRAFPASLCRVLCESVVDVLLEKWLHRGGLVETECQLSANFSRQAVNKVFAKIEPHIHLFEHDFRDDFSLKNIDANYILERMGNNTPEPIDCVSPSISTLYEEFSNTKEYGNRRDHFFALRFVQILLQNYYRHKKWRASKTAFLFILATVPVVPDIQSVSLRVLLRKEEWNIISQAYLSHVWEQIRRKLFHAAVKKEKWDAVKRWADHTLYDDQRYWAIQEAMEKGQWDICLMLAEHGLTFAEKVGLRCFLSKNADMRVLCQLLERGATVTEIEDILYNIKMSCLKSHKTPSEQLSKQINEVRVLKRKLNQDVKSPEKIQESLHQGNWCVLLHWIHQTPFPDTEDVNRVINKAIAEHAWHVVIYLTHSITDAEERDSLFEVMVTRRQWDVCRALLEQRVSKNMCLKYLSKLIDANQWVLLSRITEYGISKKNIRWIMRHAKHRRQGSIVWCCYRLVHTTVLRRERLFTNALCREVWQALKPLVEETDVTGIRHRNTALLEAIEQHQWDVVDHCQRHHADINMKDDDGHTPIHRAARKEDWEAVKELTVRDGDPNLLDIDGACVLHRAIKAKEWDAVKLLIKYHGDIHRSTKGSGRGKRTPLQMLIDAGKGDLIETSLWWSPDQGKGVTNEGKTCLHAACLSDSLPPETLYYLLARGVDPQAVTCRGHSALSFAVMNNKCPQAMVAECIKLGLSLCQPTITDNAARNKRWISPLVLAVMRGLLVVTHMLYESGSCSNRELFELRSFMTSMKHPESKRGRKLRLWFKKEVPHISHLVQDNTSPELKKWKKDFEQTLAKAFRVEEPGMQTSPVESNFDSVMEGAQHFFKIPETTRSLSSFCSQSPVEKYGMQQSLEYPFEEPDIECIRKAARYVLRVSKTPRNLKSLCRLTILKHMGCNKNRSARIQELCRKKALWHFLMFSDLTRRSCLADKEEDQNASDDDVADDSQYDSGDDVDEPEDEDDPYVQCIVPLRDGSSGSFEDVLKQKCVNKKMESAFSEVKMHNEMQFLSKQQKPYVAFSTHDQ